jgi:hypothetical protein
LEIVQDEEKPTRTKEEVIHRKVLRRNEKKEEHVNKYQVLEITVLTIM